MKNRASNKILSFILAVVMVFTLMPGGIVMPLSVSAANGDGVFADGSGTDVDPWIIQTAEQLDKVHNYLGNGNNNKYFKLGCDIDLTEYLSEGNPGYNSGAGWNPIGSSVGNAWFAGKFDGAGYKITGLWINRVDNNVGLFGYTRGESGSNNSIIKNLGVVTDDGKGGIQNTQERTGGLVGYSRDTTIENCYVFGSVASAYFYVGGLVGRFQESIVKNSYAFVNVNYNNSSTDEGIEDAGGLIGFIDDSTVTNCYASGDVTSNQTNVGGLIGIINNIGGTIQSCYATGRVEGTKYVGGLVGFANGGNITNSYFDENSTGQSSGVGRGSGSTTGKQTGEMSGSAAASLSGFNFNNTWETGNSTTCCGNIAHYPQLKVFANSTDEYTRELSKLSTIASISGGAIGDNESPFFTGNGSKATPYLIYTAEQFNHMRKHLNAHFKLMNDISLSGFTSSGGWAPIGGDSNPFAGTLDGNGNVIRNLTINRPSATYAGLFGYVSGVIKNLGINGGSVAGGSNAGSVAGQNGGTIENCYSTGSVAGNGNAGGLAGNNSGTVTSCYNTGTISGNGNTGGVAGSNSGTITSCYNVGAITGSGSLGGVAGNNSNEITSCYYNIENYTGNAIGSGTGSDSQSGGLTAVQMIKNDVLTGDMSGFGSGWSKRAMADDYCYYPELAVFYGGGGLDTPQKIASEQSVRVAKRNADTSSVTAASINYGQELSASVLSGARDALYPAIAVVGNYTWANDTDILAAGTYSRDAAFIPSSELYRIPASFSVSVTVSKWSPSLTLTASPANSLTLPGSITLTAALTGAADGNSNKAVAITVNGKPYEHLTGLSGIATHTVSNLNAGTYIFGASFVGDTNNNAATATQITGYTISLGAQEALSITGLGSNYTYGDNLFTLSTSGGSGSGTVFYASSDSTVASVSGNTVTILKAGEFTITATKAEDSSYAEAAVTSSAVTVSQADPTVTLTGANVSFGENVTLSVSVSGAGAMPEGTVTFNENGSVIATEMLSGGAASFTTTAPPNGGDNYYSVEYSGQSGYYNSGSDSIIVGVGKTDQTGFAITDPGTITYGDSSITLTTSGGQSSGGVTFSVQTGNVISVTSGGALTIINAGTATVAATKAGDSIYNEANAQLQITVNQRDISHVIVTVTGDTVYTGSQLQPAFHVSDGSLAIDTGDYYNDYGPNIDAGTGSGSVTLTGQRNYTGANTVTFSIEQRPLTGAAITLESGPYVYTGGELTPVVVSVVVDGIIVPDFAYDVSYSNNIGVGTATVTITAKATGNFSDSASAEFIIEVNFTLLDVKITEAKAITQGNYTTTTWNALQAAITNAETVRQTPGVTQAAVDAEVTALIAAISGLRANSGGSSGDDSSTTYYTVKFDTNSGSNVFNRSVAKNSTVTKPADPTREGYTFTGWYTDNALTVEYNFSAKVNGSFTLYAGWKKNTEPEPDPEPGENHAAYISGYPDGTFKPDSSMTRAEAATLFYNLLGGTAAAGSSFTDVSSSDWYYDAVTDLSGAGIISGYPDGTFRPDGTITRAEFVTIAMRFTGIAAQNGGTGFPDVSSDHWAAGYNAAAVNASYISGYPDGTFRPDGQVTRAEAVTILNRIRGCDGTTEGSSFTDVPKSHWAYQAVTAAATEHTHE